MISFWRYHVEWDAGDNLWVPCLSLFGPWRKRFHLLSSASAYAGEVVVMRYFSRVRVVRIKDGVVVVLMILYPKAKAAQAAKRRAAS